MISTPLLLTYLVSLIVTLTAAVTALSISYLRVTKQLARNERKKKELQAYLAQEYQTMLEQAHAQLLHVIEQAEKEAARLLNDAVTIKTETRHHLHDNLSSLTKEQKQTLSRIAQELLASHHRLLEDLRQDNINRESNITKHIAIDTKREVEAIQSLVIKESHAVDHALQKKATQEMEKIDQELQVYRAERLHSIEEEISNLVKMLTKNMLSKSLSQKDHQQLILEALEKAKKEGVFAI